MSAPSYPCEYCGSHSPRRADHDDCRATAAREAAELRLADVSPADLAAYRAARDAFLVAGDAYDAAWNRWFAKRQRGERTNGARASALGNHANWLSTLLADAEGKLLAAEVDPADVDKLDGVQREVSYG